MAAIMLGLRNKRPLLIWLVLLNLSGLISLISADASDLCRMSCCAEMERCCCRAMAAPGRSDHIAAGQVISESCPRTCAAGNFSMRKPSPAELAQRVPAALMELERPAPAAASMIASLAPLDFPSWRAPPLVPSQLRQLV